MNFEEPKILILLPTGFSDTFIRAQASALNKTIWRERQARSETLGN